MDIIEDDAINSPDVFILPPDNSNETDVDSDESDDDHVGNVNHLPRGILSQPCELVRDDDDDEYEAEDLMTLVELRRSMKDDEGEQSYEKSKWTNPTVIADETRRECDPEQPSTDSRTAKTPLDYFKLFFDMELLSTIVEQSKKYALQKNTSLDLSTDELHVFLGILLFSGYGKQHGGLQEHLSIDEIMVPYYGKHYAKQYIRGKPIRFGFKNWALCTNEGYMVGFDIYIGKNSSLEKHFGVGGDIVLALLQQTEVPKNQGYRIYFDNYFTSLPLLAHLSAQKYCATGTNPLTDVRFDNTGHMIIYNNTDRRCKHCGKKCQFICEKCNIALHPKQCFKDFHLK
ncbi:transposase is4 [Holotrichia oblita]|uniref:Transposase is4 n=1 Tax=Holotrichia oblita TaxID=644536 RepID=A0ACB9TLT7_HOLOL|nr:transposase is4 [Holotrichia oblita]